MRINGIGIVLLGVSPPDRSGISTATVWFTFVFLPLLPLQRLRVRFLPHQGDGCSYEIISRTGLSLPEILKTFVFCWFLIPAAALMPFIPAIREIWAVSGLPEWLHVGYLLACFVWLIGYIWKTADRHEARCRPPKNSAPW